MSTVQELPSPAVSIPYSFLPRSSEDTVHARSNSAPGEFVRDSQTLPSAKIDLSKPQWTSKQADSHPAKGLDLSMPASVSVDRLDQKKVPPNARAKPNLTIEIKNDARMKPKAIGVRGNDVDDGPPPPPPPKSPRHDSRNQSLNNISYEPRKVRRTHSRNASRSSTRSHSSPDSAHPSDGATTASQGSFVKAALVNTPSPSSSTHPKPLIPAPKRDTSSPLSGDVRIQELMAMTGQDARDDLERPVPPPITPGRPRVASLARVVSAPKTVSAERPGSNTDVTHVRGSSAISRAESKAIDISRPAKQAESNLQTTEKSSSANDPDAQTSQVAQSARSGDKRTASPAVSSTTSKGVKTKGPKPNLDKPMPSLPPPSSRQSEYRREALGLGGGKDENAPPVPSMSDAKEKNPVEQGNVRNASSGTATDKPAIALDSQSKAGVADAKHLGTSNTDAIKKKETGVMPSAEDASREEKTRGPEKTATGTALSAFPAVPPPPRYFPGNVRAQSPSGRMPQNQRPPFRDGKQQEAGRDSSPARKVPPSHPANQRVHHPGAQPMPNQPGPPRSRFYGRQPESANSTQVRSVDSSQTPERRDVEVMRGNAASPDPGLRAQSPANLSRPPLVQTPPVEERKTPILETEARGNRPKPQRQRNEDDRKQTTSNAKPFNHHPVGSAQKPDLLQRPQSPANVQRATSPTPSARPSSPADLLNKTPAAKTLPGLPRGGGPRPTTPDAASILASSDPAETLRALTKQSEALHARYASLRSDRLVLSTAISASLRDSKPGPEYANSLLDQHLSLNAINSSLDICFAKLKSLDCKKEEAIHALVEQTKEKQMSGNMYRSASVRTHSTKASVSSHSSKASTPEIGFGHLPALREREVPEPAPATVTGNAATVTEHKHGADSPVLKGEEKVESKSTTTEAEADSDCGSVTDGLPTPRPVPPLKVGSSSNSRKEANATEASATSPSQKRNTMVKMPSVSPAPSLFTNELVNMSPVSPIEDNDNGSILPPKRIIVKGVKAAKILGMVGGRSESPTGITLPDIPPSSSRGSPGKELAVGLKIQRKPLPDPPKKAAPPPPNCPAPTPPQPGRKRTNDSASTVQTDSSPESEVGTPRASEEDLVPKSLKIGRKPPSQQDVVQVYMHDDDILDYYSR